jgi:hypothetical protein
MIIPALNASSQLCQLRGSLSNVYKTMQMIIGERFRNHNWSRETTAKGSLLAYEECRAAGQVRTVASF